RTVRAKHIVAAKRRRGIRRPSPRRDERDALGRPSRRDATDVISRRIIPAERWRGVVDHNLSDSRNERWSRARDAAGSAKLGVALVGDAAAVAVYGAEQARLSASSSVRKSR
ncbi:hypothetical protein RTBOTA2_000208, partial [Rhodotorula toruloides]